MRTHRSFGTCFLVTSVLGTVFFSVVQAIDKCGHLVAVVSPLARLADGC